MALVGPILTLSHHGVSSAVVEINYDNNAERLASAHARHILPAPAQLSKTVKKVGDGKKDGDVRKVVRPHCPHGGAELTANQN